MSENHKIDNLDRSILSALQQDARVPYAELGKRFAVSPATIHVRVEKMKQAGIISGTQAMVDVKQLGYDVCCFIGINLKSAKDYAAALTQLEELGRSIDELHHLLTDRIQAIDEIQSTETLISLHNPIARQVVP